MPTEHDATQGEAKVAPRKLGVIGVVIACVAAFAVTTGIMSREKSSADLRTWTDEQAVPTVAVIAPSSTALNPTLELPGRLEAYSRAPIYARVSGYVKGWYVDIGAKVKAGQTLTVNYLGQVYEADKPFDESYSGEPAEFPIGVGQVIPGWDERLVGRTVGSRVILEIPPADGYGEQGNEQAGIKGTDTLFFVVDILGAS